MRLPPLRSPSGSPFAVLCGFCVLRLVFFCVFVAKEQEWRKGGGGRRQGRERRARRTRPSSISKMTPCVWAYSVATFLSVVVDMKPISQPPLELKASGCKKRAGSSGAGALRLPAPRYTFETIVTCGARGDKNWRAPKPVLREVRGRPCEIRQGHRHLGQLADCGVQRVDGRRVQVALEGQARRVVALLHDMGPQGVGSR